MKNGYGFYERIHPSIYKCQNLYLWITALQTYLLPNFKIIPSCLILTLIGLFSAFLWAIAGKSLSLLFSQYGILINRILALLLLIVAIKMAFI